MVLLTEVFVRRFSIALTIIGIFADSPLLAQSGAIAGGVNAAGRPVVGAVVRTIPATQTVTTGSDGRFRIVNVVAGTHRVEVRALGFAMIGQSTVVRAGATSEMNFVLTERVQQITAMQVVAEAEPGSMRPLPDVSSNLVLSGVKTEVLTVKGMSVNLAEKTGRQIFARVPGVFVYDMDGSGNQVNISTRGLDAHRSWEFNVRQDGVLINSDLYGYPASHYSPPGEATERVEIVRGTAGLQYGSQFGGLLNYVTRVPDTTRAFAFESMNTAGANGLLSSYHSIGGQARGITYRAYVSGRRSNGFRRNARSEYDAQYLSAEGALTPELRLRAQVGRSRYLFQIPGPLTDAMFEADPRASTRARNYFSPDILVPALRLDWTPSARTHLTAQTSAVLGDRNSVQVVGFADVPDVPNASGQYATRAVDVDRFKSLTGEARLTHETTVGGMDAIIAAGITVADNDLWRRQQGTGSRGTDYDIAITGPFGRDLHYLSNGVSVYMEAALRPTPSWSLIPGVRFEGGKTEMTGRLAYYDPAGVPKTVRHSFPLLGLRSEYRFASGRQMYGGWSQSYRPMLLKDVLPENALERTDPNLKDARGWTMEGGLRGPLGTRVSMDATLFLMRIDDRFGTLLQVENGTSVVFKTNVGASETKGLELALNAMLWQRGDRTLSAFTATSYFDATYVKGSVVVSGANQSIVGREVESAPHWISRNGLSWRTTRANASATVSHVSRSFSDPQNTVAATANGARGIVPAYTLLDLGGGLTVTDWLAVKVSVSNALGLSYFTKRPAFYPGPGVWPSDGRGVQVAATFTP